MRKSGYSSKDEKITYVIVAPGVIDTGDGYQECEAIFCYDNTEHNPLIYWDSDIAYSAAYTCIQFADPALLERYFEKDYLENTKLRGGLVSVDLDRRKIIKITRTTTIVEAYEEVEVGLSLSPR